MGEGAEREPASGQGPLHPAWDVSAWSSTESKNLQYHVNLLSCYEHILAKEERTYFISQFLAWSTLLNT